MIVRTLFARLALALTLLLLGIGILYALLSATLTRHYQQEFLQSLNRDLASNLVTGRNLVTEGILDQEALKKTFNHYMMVNPSIEIYLLDQDGTILSYSAEPGKVKRDRVDLQPVRDFLSGTDFPLLGDDPRNFERRKVFSATRIPVDGKKFAYLYVVLRGEEYERIEQLFQQNFMLQLSGAALLVSLGIGLVVGLLLFRLLTRRLQSLAHLMRSFSESKFTQHTPWQLHHRRKDEIELLGQHYNSMAERILEQLDDLKKQDVLRRKLVANVSHDLRTPLAAMQGYIETLQMKEQDFDSRTRSEYLDTALQHSRRVTKLVDELFELAKLDARETQPQKEPFALAELVQDVIQKFQLPARERHIVLSMQSYDSLPFVDADIAMIERVLENLIGNALQHTSAEGEVTVSLRPNESTIEVQVQDNGSGIPEHDLSSIFDRFYRADNNERNDSHAGLGLAIAQHIVRLHDGIIEVSSEINLGTRFFFSLPVWHKP
ncbi:MAG: ATP-binding protein [Gammaproteobacteria bacterium]|nr:MAG: ATP-binding protein [Gammaproteobacteria bacterium]